MPLTRGGQPLLARVPQLEVGLEPLFYVRELLVVLRGNDSLTRRVDERTPSQHRDLPLEEQLARVEQSSLFISFLHLAHAISGFGGGLLTY